MANVYNLKKGVSSIEDLVDGYNVDIVTRNHWWVDGYHGDDGADGRTRATAVKTIGQVLTNVAAFGYVSAGVFTNNGDVIHVLPALYSEACTITDYEQFPSYIWLKGEGVGIFSPSWYSGAAASPALVQGSVGMRISGFRFYAPAAEACIVIPCTQGAGWSNAIGIRTIIEGCYFDGSVYAGKYGVNLHGAPYDVEIRYNRFAFLTDANARGICSTDTGFADAYRANIHHNWFYESIGAIDASLNVSRVVDNDIQTGGATTMTTGIDLRTGTIGKNIVTRNHLYGDYSNAGGFYAGTSDDWIGNVSNDLTEAEVYANTGTTIAVPT
jgi:hypothetical protein